MDNNSKIFIAGHLGMVGSAIQRQLAVRGHPSHLIINRKRDELDLTNQKDVNNFFVNEKPDEVYLAAARVGGIHANNTYPADFIYDNLMIQTNVIEAAFRSGVKKLLFLGSSCVYPKYSVQPITEDALLSGPLEPTNEPYAIAKIAGIKMCESYNRQYSASHGVDYRSVMPTNLYGPGDNYHPVNSHVIPSLLRRFHDAKLKGIGSVSVWGSGKQKREFLYVDDLAEACVLLMSIEKKVYELYTQPMVSHVNVGFGAEIQIRNVANTIAQVVGFKGAIQFDTAKPDGPPSKMVDSKLIKSLSWKPKFDLKQGLRLTYKDFLKHHG